MCVELAAGATARLKSGTAAAVVVAPPLGPPTCVVGDGDPLVAIWLMLDPLDIDSKQTTFCRGGDATRSMQTLYKWTGSATPPVHTELPGAIAEEGATGGAPAAPEDPMAAWKAKAAAKRAAAAAAAAAPPA